MFDINTRASMDKEFNLGTSINAYNSMQPSPAYNPLNAMNNPQTGVQGMTMPGSFMSLFGNPLGIQATANNTVPLISDTSTKTTLPGIGETYQDKQIALNQIGKKFDKDGNIIAQGWGDMSTNQKINTGYGVARGVWDIYSGFKGLALAKKQMAQQEQQWMKTYQAQAKAQNADSWLRAMDLNGGDRARAEVSYAKDRISEKG